MLKHGKSVSAVGPAHPPAIAQSASPMMFLLAAALRAGGLIALSRDEQHRPNAMPGLIWIKGRVSWHGR